MSSPGTPPQPPSQFPVAPIAPGSVPPASRALRPPSRRRALATVLLVAAVVMSGLSLGFSWWTISATSDGNSANIYFLPGSDVSATNNGYSATGSYSSAGLNNTGNLFGTVFYLVVGVLALSALGALFAAASTAHPKPKETWGNGVVLLSLVGAALAVVSVVLVPLVAPSLFADDNPSNICGKAAGAGNPSPCTSWSGSLTNSAGTLSWGGDVGWYFMIAAAALLVVGLVVWYVARNEPWSRELPVPLPDASAEVAGRPGAVSGLPAPAATGSTSPGVPAVSQAPAPAGPEVAGPPPDSWLCPGCGTQNALPDRACPRCGQPAPPRA